MNDSIKRTQQLKLYSTDTHPCSYLANKEATTLFVDPKADIDSVAFSYLTEQGFWRSGEYIFKPDCGHCQSCLPIRIPVNRFLVSRNEKRCLNKNRDLHTTLSSRIDGDLLFPLYQKYIHARHSTGDMFPAKRAQFDNFLSTYHDYSRLICFYLGDQLVAASILDETDDGFMAIYTFYDPELTGRSLGKYAILWQILYARLHEKEHLYLGYWIRECHKMAYKSLYKPSEVRINGRWVNLI